MGVREVMKMRAKAAAEAKRKAFKKKYGVSMSNLPDLAMDLNGDGRVTRSEARAFRAAAAAKTPESTRRPTKRAMKAMKSAVKKGSVKKKVKAAASSKKPAAAPTFTITKEAPPRLSRTP